MKRKLKDQLKKLGLKIFFILVIGYVVLNMLNHNIVLINKHIDGIILGLLLIPIVLLVFDSVVQIVTINTLIKSLNGEIANEDLYESGKVYINESNEIIWERHHKILTRIKINDIRIIGECTTANGPIIEDWFYLYILGINDVRQVSAYALGVADVMKKLGDKLNADLKPSLAASTKWESNILWPSKLIGQKVFDEVSIEPTSLAEKIKVAIGIVKRHWDLTKNVKKILVETF